MPTGFVTELQLLVGLGLLAGVFAAMYSDTFATVANAENMSRVAGILLVVAVGQMFALVVGGFDISVGANMGFVSTVCALGMTQWGGLGTGIALGLLAGAAVGLVNGILIAGLGVSPFVATLGMLTFLGGLANELSDGASVSGLPAGFSSFGGGDWGPIPASVGMAAIVLVLTWLVLSRVRAGLYIFAIGGSRETARLAGVPVVRYEVLAYTACGLLAGVAGIMLASRVSVGQASLGQGYDLLSIATAVIGGVAIGGGIGRLSGVVLGVALLTVLTTGMDIAGTGEFIQQMVTGAVLVVSVLLARLRGIRLPGLRWAVLSRSRQGPRRGSADGA
jgi:ribose transport system permease protein